jgi:hypothetical protein
LGNGVLKIIININTFNNSPKEAPSLTKAEAAHITKKKPFFLNSMVSKLNKTPSISSGFEKTTYLNII